MTPLFKNANDGNYNLNARVRYLLYYGLLNPTSLTENSTNLYSLSLIMVFNFTIYSSKYLIANGVSYAFST